MGLSRASGSVGHDTLLSDGGTHARPVQLEDGMAVDYLTDPNGSMFALFGPKPES